MGKVLKFCPKCRKENKSPWYGYYPFMEEDSKCTVHLCDMQTIDLDKDDYFTILTISHDVNFLEAMINLKQDNIIEYQSRMSQFRNQILQQKAAEDDAPKCPNCHSANISPIGTGERVGSVAMWGLFSKKINKSFKCKDCGYTW